MRPLESTSAISPLSGVVPKTGVLRLVQTSTPSVVWSSIAAISRYEPKSSSSRSLNFCFELSWFQVENIGSAPRCRFSCCAMRLKIVVVLFSIRKSLTIHTKINDIRTAVITIMLIVTASTASLEKELKKESCGLRAEGDVECVRVDFIFLMRCDMCVRVLSQAYTQ